MAETASAVTPVIQQTLAARDEELAAIISSMKDGLIVLDRKQRVTRLNPAMEKILGLETGEAVGKTISELNCHPRFSPLARLSRVQSPSEEVVIVYPVDRVLKVHCSKLKGYSDEDMGEVRVVIDVTQEKEFDQMKADFIANTSHELRTPLHSIRGFLKLLLDGKVAEMETQQEFLGIIDEESKHLSNLVDGILNIAAMESGKMTFNVQPVSMKEVIERVMVKLKSLADEKEISIKTSLPDSLPIIEGDLEKLEQVVKNLAGNAIKFSSARSKIHIGAETQNESEVLVQVADQGIGIHVDDVPRLFQKFSQVDSSTTRAQGGTGLGLYISKQIIEAHGGKIWVESELGKGTTFFFTVSNIAVDERKKKKVGEILIEDGFITEDQLRDALRRQEL